MTVTTKARMRKYIRILRRSLACLLAALLAVILLPACGGADTEALLDRARELIPQAVELDALLYVDGIPVSPGVEASGGYVDADAEALAALGFRSVSDIKERMREIYTERYVRNTERSALFSSVFSEGQAVTYAYVIDVYDKDVFRGVRVLAERSEVLRMDRTSYDLTTLTVTSTAKKSAKLSVLVTVTNADGESQTRTRELTLSMDTDGTWRLDSGTYMKYRTSI